MMMLSLSKHSTRTDLTQRSVKAFAFGTWNGVWTTVIRPERKRGASLQTRPYAIAFQCSKDGYSIRKWQLQSTGVSRG
jgi:hypothetical protein